VIWGPFLLALALGLLVSAGLYFAYLWPQVEPEDPAPVVPRDKDETAHSEPATAKPERDPEPEPKESA